MSEYIITDEQIAENRRLHGKKLLVMPVIVRCRDCKHCDTYITRWTKKPIHECLAEWCEGSEGDHPLVELNWFCSWGERKDTQRVKYPNSRRDKK